MTFLFSSFQEYITIYGFSVLSLIIELTSFTFKVLVLFFLYKKTLSTKRNKSYFYLMLIILTGTFTSITLSLHQFQILSLGFIPKVIPKIFFRLECATLTVQFFALMCFFKNLSSKPISKKIINIFVIPTVILVFYYFFKAICSPFILHLGGEYLGDIMIRLQSAYNLIVGSVALLIIYRNYSIESLGLIKKHISTLGLYFLFPYLVAKIFETAFVSVGVNVPAATITTLILSGMLYYCSKKLIGLRFMNIGAHVESKISEKFSFIDDFKTVLGRLGSVSSLDELVLTTKDFFQKAFDIPTEEVSFLFKGSWLNKQKIVDNRKEEEEKNKLYIEKVLSSKNDYQDILSFVNDNKILIRDEIEFSHFYSVEGEKRDELAPVVEFLKTIDSDIFLPIYSDSKIVAYITIHYKARPEKFYTDVERDEMLIYANYIGSIIYLLANMNLDTILLREKEIQAKAYKNEKKFELLKKCVQPLLSTAKTRKIGVLTYKNKKFGYCNQSAKDIIKVDLNSDKGLEFTQNMLKIGSDVATFFSSKKVLITAPKGGEQLVVSASPNLEKNNTVITVSNPTISDLVKDKLSALKDQKKWGYLLALNTTEEGMVVNQLLPSDTTTILNAKINFLENSITRKSMLLEMSSNEDGLSFAHAAHKINKRHILEEIIIERSFDDEPLELKLFGMNPIFQQRQESCLFEYLNGKGTLLIQNVHLLSLGLQKKLLDFIVSGKYFPLRSDASVESDVLLICSTNQNLLDLVGRGHFLKELYLELQKCSVWLPSLAALPEDEFVELSEKLRQQLVYSKLYQNLLVFTESDRKKLLSSGCVSLNELKTKIQNIVLKKTRRQSINESVMDPAYQISDFELVEAARLGKHALKDPKILTTLMNKFKNNQSKVAVFLGVNRSTVNRRCSQYGIDVIPYTKDVPGKERSI